MTKVKLSRETLLERANKFRRQAAEAGSSFLKDELEAVAKSYESLAGNAPTEEERRHNEALNSWLSKASYSF
jgi:hypothetical protein